MTPAELFHSAGWAGYLSAAATVVTFVTGVLFFTKGQPYGTAQDAASVFQMLFTLLIVLALYHLLRPDAQALNPLAAAVGVIGLLVAAALQTLLVLGKVHFEQTIGKVLGAGAAIGVWVVATGCLTLASGTQPSGLAWMGPIAGGGYTLLVVGFWQGGQQHPLFTVGSLAAMIGYPVWAIWLGRALISGTLTTSA